jgi:tetratricopeptide (TPR) repeat protein
MKLLKTTKGRLILVLGCALLLAGGGATAYLIRKQHVRAQFMAWRAEGMSVAKAGNDNAKAVDLLGRYLSRYPEDVDVLVEYVRIRPLVKEPNRQHLQDTMRVLQHLLMLRPDMQEQRRTLLKMYGDYGYPAEAVVTADKLLESNPKDPEALGIRAKALARMRRLGDALKAAQAWAAVAPQDVDAQLLCLDMMQANGKAREEIVRTAEALRGTLQDSPSFDWERGMLGGYWSAAVGESASFELVRGIAAADTGSPREAAEWIRKAAAHPGADKDVRQAVARAMDGLGMHEESLALLKHLVRDYADPAQQKFLMRRTFEVENWGELLSYPLTGELATDPELKGMVGMALALTGKKEEAGKVAAELSGAKDDAVAAVWGDVLNQLLTQKVDARRSFDLCQAALKDVPGDAYVRCFLGQACLSLGETELATSNLEQAAQQAPNWAAPLVSLSKAYLSTGRVNRAYGAALAAAGRSRQIGVGVQLAIAGNAKIQLSQGGVSNGGDEDKNLKALVTEIEDHTSGQFYVMPERVAILAREKKKEEAVGVAKKALSAATPPGNVELQRLASVSRAYGLGLEDQVYGVLESRGGATPSLALSRSMMSFVGGVKAGSNDAAKGSAIAQFDAARKRASNGEALEWQVARAKLLDFTGDAAASKTWAELGDGHADDLSVQRAALGAMAVKSDRDFMDRTIERVKKLSSGEGVQWRVERARWLLERPVSKDADQAAAKRQLAQSAEQASLLLTEAIRLAPDSADARMLQARALEMQGNAGAAVEQLTTVVKQNPSLGAARVSLAKLLQKRGDFVQARQYLDEFRGSGLQNVALREEVARLLAVQGDPQKAIDLLRENGASEGADSLLLARLYRQKNDFKSAEAICTKLMEKPTLEVIAFAADLYGAMGRDADARKAIAMLKTMKVEPGMEDLLLAEYAFEQGRLGEAVEASRRATKAAPQLAAGWRALVVGCLATRQFNEAASAADAGLKAIPTDPYLNALKGVRSLISQGMSSPDVVPLALALARDPQMAGTKEALEVVAGPGASSEPKPRQLARLRQVADQYVSNLPVQLFTAGRYMAGADSKNSLWDDAAAVATRAVERFPTSAEAPSLAARALVGGKRWLEVIEFARTMKARRPSVAYGADTLAATAYLKLQKPQEALKLLAPYMSEAMKQPDKNAGTVALYAACLQVAGKREEAEKLLMPALRASDEVRTAWVQRATQDLPLNEAVMWVSRVAEMSGDNSLEGQVQLAQSSGELGKKGNAKLLSVAREIRSQIAARKDLSPLALAVLGSQAEQTGDFAEAEALYRRAIAADSSFVVAKNNLAMVLMQHGGDLKEAIKLVEEAIARNPAMPNYYDTLAQVQAKAGETKKAVETIREAVKRDPEAASWQVSLAERLADAGQNKEAVTTLDAALAKSATSEAIKKDPELKQRVESLRSVLGEGKTPVSSVKR